MQDQATGVFTPIEADTAGILERIAAAGRRELPIFAVGDEVEIRNGHFRVLALDGKLLVLQGIPAPDFAPAPGMRGVAGADQDH